MCYAIFVLECTNSQAERKAWVLCMIKKFIVSWFRSEAGLLFFTAFIISTFFLTDIFGLAGDSCTIVSAEEGKPIVIVIDPGHGGENLGGEYEDYTEKEMTLITAKAMKEELEKYEGITVYMTRMGDAELSLDERCEYAASVGADFLFCLHYNLSAEHTLFGAETWISAFGEQYSKGYAFATIEIGLLQEMGLYSRGIKTRLNEDGVDYYGIIRHSTERGMPCVLIEHCHLDQDNDKPFYDHKEKLEAFGRLDAEAVARYFGLRSATLGKDYSGYQNISVNVPSQVMKPDSTQPDVCVIELVEQNRDNGDIRLKLSAADYDSGMLYYTYSYDGGQTFSELQRWPDKTRDTFEFTINVPSGVTPQIAVNAYNGYDLYTTSNTLYLTSMVYKGDEETLGEDGDNSDNVDGENIENTESSENTENTENIGNVADAENSADTEKAENVSAASSDSVLSKDDYIDITYDLDAKDTKEQQQITISYFLKVSLVCVIIVVAMIFSMVFILNGYKRRRN